MDIETKNRIIDILIKCSLIGNRYQKREEFERLANEIMALVSPQQPAVEYCTCPNPEMTMTTFTYGKRVCAWCHKSLPEKPKQEGRFNPQSMDAKVWAKEFMRLWNEKFGSGQSWIDEELMIGWFANAIMAGFDEANRRNVKQEPKIEEISCDMHGYSREYGTVTMKNICDTIDEIIRSLKEK